MPRVQQVSLATMAKVAAEKKSCVTERQRSQIGLIVVCFSRAMNGCGIETVQFAERLQEFGGRGEADRRLQVGLVQRLAQRAAELAIHADVDLRLCEPRHVGEGGDPSEEDEINLGARMPSIETGGFRRDRTAC